MKTIVLVEDDEPIRHAIHTIFKAAGHNFVNLDSGEKIVNGEIEIPDLFILDRQISGTNGLEVCREIRLNDRYKNVPVIMLSASPDINLLAQEAGANEAITKPFSLKKIRETVSKYLS